MEIHYLEREISLFGCKIKYLALIFLIKRQIYSFFRLSQCCNAVLNLTDMLKLSVVLFTIEMLLVPI